MKNNIDLQSPISLSRIHAWMDGGSLSLSCTNKKGEKYDIWFHQKMGRTVASNGYIPGRLYIEGDLINQRSQEEKYILRNIKNANWGHLDGLEKSLLQEAIDYVESQEYLEIMKELKYVTQNFKISKNAQIVS